MNLDEVYRSFLESSVLRTWIDCLNRHRPVLQRPSATDPAHAKDLTHGTIIAMYVSWLSSVVGERKKAMR